MSCRFALALAAGTLVVAGCDRAGATRVGEVGDAAEKVYVAPGKYDEFYAFMSGGFDGQVGVYGLPSGRLLRHVPVFSQNPENGWGYSEQTKADAARPATGSSPGTTPIIPSCRRPPACPTAAGSSSTATTRRASPGSTSTRFETEEILEIPNSAGNHSSPVRHREHRVRGRGHAVQRSGSQSGRLDRRLQVGVRRRADVRPGGQRDRPHGASPSRSGSPAFNYDLAHAGKGPSHGWAFFTSYNSEEAQHQARGRTPPRTTRTTSPRSNWKRAEALRGAGQGEDGAGPVRAQLHRTRTGIARTEWGRGSEDARRPPTCPGLVYYLPTPKSPHGVDVDPTGEFIVAGGKLADRDPGALLLQDAEGDRRQGVRRRGERHPGAQVRGRRSRAKCRTPAWARCTPSSTARATPTPRCSSPPRS